MTTLERKEPIPGGYEASKSLSGKGYGNGYPCNLPLNKPVVKDCLRPKNSPRLVNSRESAKVNGAGMEPKKPSTDVQNKPVFKPDYSSKPMSVIAGFQNVQPLPANTIEGQFYPYIDYWYGGAPAVPYEVFGYAYPYEAQFQEFQYFVVIDFEATCDKDKIPHPQEIIEFPSVLVNSMTGQLESYFQTYVRPTCNMHLTDFCKDLTGIQQTQVDKGVTLSNALFLHDKWLEQLGIKDSKFAVVTWSDWDCRVMLESECRFKNIQKPPYFNQWINLRVPFREVFGSVRCNLREAVEHAGLTWEGRAHCGLDDARNTARLLAYFMQIGFKFSITNSLTLESADFSFPKKQFHENQYSPPNYYTPPSELQRYCFCGFKSTLGMATKPGTRYFFCCGNWSQCQFFEWATPAPYSATKPPSYSFQI